MNRENPLVPPNELHLINPDIQRWGYLLFGFEEYVDVMYNLMVFFPKKNFLSFVLTPALEPIYLCVILGSI